MKKLNDFKQLSVEWFEVRRGIPTSSNFKKFITDVKGEYSKSADSYAERLIAEALGWVDPFKGNVHTERGNELEPDARRWLEFQHGCDVAEVGFCLSDCGRWGGSPDGLLDDGTPIEIKSPDLPGMVAWRIAGTLPIEHRTQCHAHMILTGSSNCLFVAYSAHEALQPLVIDVKRDAFTDLVERHLDTFCKRLEVLQRQILGADFSKYIKPKA